MCKYKRFNLKTSPRMCFARYFQNCS
uniref:Uncharacterized protein n=1 Tax=Arundo donax TaxID=35708 RepID=A0A0A9AIC7_ARUDO